MDIRRKTFCLVDVTSSVRSLVTLVTLVGALVITGSFTMPLADATSLGASNTQRKALALQEAHHLLTLATLPQGSTRLATWNGADGPALSSTSPVSGDPDQVDLTEYFLAPGGDGARQWLDARVPKGGTPLGSGTSSGLGTDDVTYRSFSFRATSSFLSPQLQYSVLITPQGDLGLRVDANVTWTPRKSTFSIVAPGATKVVVIVNRGLNVRRGKITTLTTTDPTTIDYLITHVNQLPAKLPGVEMCPLDVLASLTLQFFARGAPHPYAVVVADPDGCGNVDIRQYGVGGTLLGATNVSGGSIFAGFVAKKMGITNVTGLSPACVRCQKVPLGDLAVSTIQKEVTQ